MDVFHEKTEFFARVENGQVGAEALAPRPAVVPCPGHFQLKVVALVLHTFERLRTQTLKQKRIIKRAL